MQQKYFDRSLFFPSEPYHGEEKGNLEQIILLVTVSIGSTGLEYSWE